MSMNPKEAMVAARAAWARDEETLIDLGVIADELFESLRWAKAASRDWPSDIKAIARMDPAALAEGLSWAGGNPSRGAVITCLADAKCGALSSGRRRWAQAMSLAGAWGDPSNPEEQYRAAAAVCAQWMIQSVAWLPTRFPNTRVGAIGIREAKLAAIGQTLESLVSFGSQMGIEDPEAKASQWLISTRDRLGKKDEPGLSDGWLAAVMDKAAIKMIAPKMDASGASQRPRL